MEEKIEEIPEIKQGDMVKVYQKIKEKTRKEFSPLKVRSWQ